MQIQLDGSGPVDLAEPPSFTLSQSGTFVKEDFVINRQGIAAVNGTEVARVVGLKLQDLEMGEIIGKGASSLVRRAIHKPSQTELAVKIISVFDKAKRDQLLRELRTLYSSAFPWLVSFHDCLYDEGAMYIVLECAAARSPNKYKRHKCRSLAYSLHVCLSHLSGTWTAALSPTCFMRRS